MKKTQGAIGFREQKEALETVVCPLKSSLIADVKH